MSNEPRGRSTNFSNEPLVGARPVRHSVCGSPLVARRSPATKEAHPFASGEKVEVPGRMITFCDTCGREVPASEYEPQGAICLSGS